MAFYKDINKQDRRQKRQNAEQRGGFNDEGSGYAGERKAPGRTHDRPQRAGQQGAAQSEGQRPRTSAPRGNRPRGSLPTNLPTVGSYHRCHRSIMSSNGSGMYW